MDMLVVLNPAAGGGRALRRWKLVEQVLARQQVSWELHRTTAGPGNEETLRTIIAGGRFTRVMAVGGDGTAHLVANAFFDPARRALVRKGVSFGLVAGGTGCDLARAIHGAAGLEAQVLTCISGTPRPFDLIGCDVDGMEWQVAINMVSAGIGGEVCMRVGPGSKWIGSSIAYLLSSIRAVLTLPPWRMTLSVDGDSAETVEVRQIFLANGPTEGGGMMVAPDASWNDGQLDMVIMADMTRWQALRVGLGMFMGRRSRRGLICRRCRRIRIEPAENAATALLELDGEVGSSLPVTLEILPGALDLIMAHPHS